jgi:4a-hydroxytetrahydrobiopterin dehydratase
MTTLTLDEIGEEMKDVPDWVRRAKVITRTYKFDGFPQSIAFVDQIAKRAQKLRHHPDIDIRYDQVTLELTTHDAGGLTEKDFTLAEQCDEEFDILSEG